jgi:hypothetical protein
MSSDSNDGIRVSGQELETVSILFAQQLIDAAIPAESSAGFRNMVGMTASIVVRLIIRGVPRNGALELIKEKYGEGVYEQARHMYDAMEEYVRGARLGATQETVKPILIEPIEDYSAKKDEMEEIGAVASCLGAYITGDDRACVATGLKALDSHQMPMLFLLPILSLERMGMEAEAKHLASRAVEALRFLPFHRDLARILVEEIDGESVFAHAANDTERCQVRFYEGARDLAHGKTLKARIALAECLRFDTDVMEKPTAEMLLNPQKV